MHTAHVGDRLYISQSPSECENDSLSISVMCPSTEIQLRKKVIQKNIEIHAGQYDNSIF